MTLARRGAQDGVGLSGRIAELCQVLDRVQTGLAISNMNVEVVLLALLVDRDAFEDQIIIVCRNYLRGFEDRILDSVFVHAAFNEVDLQVDPSSHLDGATEGDLAVTLAEVKVAHRQAGALYINRKKDLRAARQILDIAVAAMLARRNGARAFGRNLVFHVALGSTAMRRGRERRISQRWHTGWIGVDECLFAGIPGFEHFLVRQAADQARMDEAGKADARNMPRVRVKTGNIPDRFLRQREVVGQEAAAIPFGKEAVKAPRAFGQYPDIENIDDKEVARLGTMHTERS